MALASLGDYRAGVIEELQKRIGDHLTIFAGSPAYDPSIRLLNYEAAGIKPVANHYYGPDILIQSISIRRLLRADSVILDLNPRVPHVWLIASLRRLIGKPTILWGHAWPRSGAESTSDRVRSALRSLATGIVTYTESQAKLLRQKHPKKPVFSAPNSLYSKNQMGFNMSSHRFRILYVGRLVKEKKPKDLIDAFDLIASSMPNIKLTIIGDGPERHTLEASAKNSRHSDRIEFPGYISKFESLRPYYAETIVSVSPGYVGLSITQSLAFGVPMLISRSENHSPEIEAAIDGFNCRFFETDRIESLAESLLLFIKEAELWKQRGADIAADCGQRYSVERMADGFAQAFHFNS